MHLNKLATNLPKRVKVWNDNEIIWLNLKFKKTQIKPYDIYFNIKHHNRHL